MSKIISFNEKREKIHYYLLFSFLLLVLVVLYFNMQRDTQKDKVILIGIDAADWYFINPLLREGKLPNLHSLLQNASYGNLSTVTREPYGGAPMQWTSVATGKTYEKHGITDYYQYPGLNSKMRKTKAIWNILSENDIKVGIVGWWATWPAEKVNGYLASSYVKYKAEPPNITLTKNEKLQLTYTGTIYASSGLNQTYPQSFYHRIEPIIKEKENIPDSEINLHFKNLSKIREREIFYDIKWNYISNEIFSSIGKLFLNDSTLDFISIIEHGIDVAFHRTDVANPDLANLLDDYYIYIDEKIGESLNYVDENVTFIIVSEHGHNGPKDHIFMAIDGIIIVKGPNIKKNHKIENASVVDIAPTILYLFDLPIPMDIDGKVLLDIFDGIYIKNHPIKYIDSYDTKNSQSYFNMSYCPFDEEIYKRVKKIGYFEN